MPSRPLDRRTILRLCGAALATIGTSGCLSGGSSSDPTVSMAGDFAFEPETATVESGGTVTWTNDSDVAHTVTADEDEIPDGAAYFASGGFETERAARNRVTDGLVAAGETFEHTFERTGTYGYYCIPHEGSGIIGTIRVE